MRGRTFHLAAALTLLAVPVLSSCSSTRAGSPTRSSPGVAASDNAHTSCPCTGKTVTMEVPHSKETVSDIKEREAMEPLPPRGDVAIPSHRIQRGDNTAAPTPPAGVPAGK